MNSNSFVGKLMSFNFEVFGVVQGVFFRKYTEDQAKKLDLRGWCCNTETGSVKGVVQGLYENCQQMENWLSQIGSPHSKIEKFVKSNVKVLEKLEYSWFEVKDDDFME